MIEDEFKEYTKVALRTNERIAAMDIRLDQETFVKQIMDKVGLVGEFMDSLRKELDSRS